MFLHNLKYELFVSIRARDLVIWLMIWPIILGSFYKIAFGSIYENDILFETIPTAIVENEKNEIFHSIIDQIEEQENPLLKASFLSEEDAMKALENDEVKAIIYVESSEQKENPGENFSFFGEMMDTAGVPSMDTKLTLKITSNGIEQTILKKFTENYMAQESIIRDAVMNNPLHLEEVTKVLTQDMTINEKMPLTEGNTDPFAAYMYNLIAMVSMFGCITGLHIAIGNQANLSDLGARRNCSPTNKLISITAGLIGSYLVQGLCAAISITYEVLVLGVDFGSRLPFVYLAGFVGGMMGVSLGFLVGSFSNWSQGVKVGVLMGVTMLLCFCSGLMFGDIKAIIELNIPLFNDLNPSAVIADSLYYLEVDPDLSRYFIKILVMIVFSVVFAIGGFLLTRRKKYASL